MRSIHTECDHLFAGYSKSKTAKNVDIFREEFRLNQVEADAASDAGEGCFQRTEEAADFVDAHNELVLLLGLQPLLRLGPDGLFVVEHPGGMRETPSRRLPVLAYEPFIPADQLAEGVTSFPGDAAPPGLVKLCLTRATGGCYESVSPSSFLSYLDHAIAFLVGELGESTHRPASTDHQSGQAFSVLRELVVDLPGLRSVQHLSDKLERVFVSPEDRVEFVACFNALPQVFWLCWSPNANCKLARRAFATRRSVRRVFVVVWRDEGRGRADDRTCRNSRWP